MIVQFTSCRDRHAMKAENGQVIKSQKNFSGWRTDNMVIDSQML